MKVSPTSRDPVENETVVVSDETLRQFVGYHVKRASNVVLADLARTLKPFGLRLLTYSALALIVDNPGMRQSQLAEALDIERPNLVVLLDQLEARDLIIRERVPTDRRAHALKFTLKGKRLCEKATIAVRAHEDKVLKDTDPGDLDRVLQVMQIIEASRSRS